MPTTTTSPRKRPTLAEVARLSNVSPAVASLVLSGRTGSARYSPETAERVQRIARTLHYRPSVATRILRENTSTMLGLALPGMGEAYMSKFLPGAIAAAGKLGYQIVVNIAGIGTSDYEPRIDELLARDVDGVILFAQGSFQQSEIYRELTTLRRPVVFVEHDLGGQPFDFVGVDDLDGYRQAVERLKQLGHRRIGFLYEVEGSNTWPSAHQRRLDFEQAIDEANLPVLPSAYVQVMNESSLDEYWPARAAEQDVTAVVVRGDVRARRLRERLAQVGLRVPQDLSLINITAHNYDNDRLRFDSIWTPLEQMGARCVELLVEQIRHPRPPRRELFKGMLVPGETCRVIGSTHE